MEVSEAAQKSVIIALPSLPFSSCDYFSSVEDWKEKEPKKASQRSSRRPRHHQIQRIKTPGLGYDPSKVVTDR